MTDYDNYTAYFNGEWVAYEDVKIAPHDRGFMLADVVFDVARTFNGKPFMLDRHMNRLYRSLKYLRIDSGIPQDEMAALCEEAVRRNEQHLPDVGDFTINPFVTRGLQGEAGPATVCISIRPITFARYAKFYTEGAHGVIARTRSYSSQVMDPKVKHHSRLNFVQAELEAADVDPDAQPILMDEAGNLTEGIGYNMFLVKDGVLKTPTDRSILQGVSRSVIIDLAEQLGLPFSEEDLQPYDIYTADEVFFSSTSPRIMPVSRVDKRTVGDKFPGPMTQQLLSAHSELVGVDIVDQALHYAARTGR